MNVPNDTHKKTHHSTEEITTIVNQMISSGDMKDCTDSHQNHSKSHQNNHTTESISSEKGQVKNIDTTDVENSTLKHKKTLETTSSVPVNCNLGKTAEASSNVTKNNNLGLKTPKTLADSTSSAKYDQKRYNLNQIRVKMLRALAQIGPIEGNIKQQALLRLDAIEQHALPHSSPSENNHSENNSRALRDHNTKRAGEWLQKPERVQQITVLCFGIISAGKTTTIARLVAGSARASGSRMCPPPGPTTKIDITTNTVLGVEYTFIDTPGLYPAFYEKNYNERILRRIKKTISGFKPDVYLYFDRMDYPRRGSAESCVLKSIAEIIGESSISEAIVVLTHSGTSLPKAASGPLGFERFCEQRQSIISSQFGGLVKKTRSKPLFYPVENSPLSWDSKTNEYLLPNGIPWRPSLMTILVVFKSFNEINNLIKNNSDTSKSTDYLYLLGLKKHAPEKDLGYLLQQMMSQLQTCNEFGADGEHILSQTEIAQLEDDSARKDALNSRERYISQKIEEHRSNIDGRCPEVAAVAAEQRADFLPMTFGPVNDTIHRYRYLRAKSGWRVHPQIDYLSLDHDDGVKGVILVNEELVLRKPGKFTGGLPSSIRIDVEKNKTNEISRSTINFTTGKGIIPLSISGLEKTYFNVSLSYDHELISSQSNSAETSKTVRLESVTDSLIDPRNKFILGLIASRAAPVTNPVDRFQPWTCGAKFEDRISLGEEGEVSVSYGLCQHGSSGKSSQKASSFVTNFKKKINKNSSMSAQVSVNWFRRDRRVVTVIEQQQFITPRSLLTTGLSYDFKGRKEVCLKISSSDRTEIAYLLFVPILCAISNINKRDEFF